MQKLVVKLEVYDEKAKKKAMKIVSGLSGVESIHIELKDKKLTVVGDIDSVSVVNKLRKFFQADIVSVGTKKKEPAEKEEPKEAEDKKAAAYNPYQAYNPCMTTHYYVSSAEENPNACVIC